MSKNHNENTRVQVPAAVHLCRLGYTYLSHIQEYTYDHKTNILTGVLLDSILRLNPGIETKEAKNIINDLISCSSNDDLGREFYKKLTSKKSGLRLIDFDDASNNVWHCTTEFTCRNEDTTDEFRPDITCFVNGIPVAFIEVKIPNNHEGILAERDRSDRRFQNKAFRSFFNVTQLMIFSNNQEYDNESIVPVSGAFYASSSKKKAFYNVFREADKHILEKCGYNPVIPEEVEKAILTHRNCIPIKELPEYQTNKQPDTPTNRIITSMLSRDRLLFILQYAFAYVDEKKQDDAGVEHYELQKHIMRYQQLFASYAIRRKLDNNIKSGIIWHTQGSGKTALTYYNVNSLTDYFAAQNTPVKFYFIVDRLDLMEQAISEFDKRGLLPRSCDSRQALMDDIKDPVVTHNKEGKREITVVNIQKFAEDHNKVVIESQYSTKLQRVFFIDEAHRGYNPTGSFLANLLEADKDSIKIALTGTPLIAGERASWKVFGDYIDTYYYDKSIADGYTLKLIREDIETQYKEKIENILKELTGNVEVKKSDIDRSKIVESDNYLNAIIEYIVADLRKSRIQQDCKQMAGMIVCETNPQARKLFELFNNYFEQDAKPMKAYLILHDEGDKSERKGSIAEFKKKESVDFLIVNKMLLTGFDAPRLKKLYLCRKLDGHDLLQALTRVNRPFLHFKFGYIVDFANIKQNFIETNNMYLRELNRTIEGTDIPENTGVGNALMYSAEEMEQQISEIKDELWKFTTTNKEKFRQELDEIDSEHKSQLYVLRRALDNAKALINNIRSYGDDAMKQMVSELKPGDISALASEVNHRIDRLNMLEGNSHRDEVSGIINEAIAELDFKFQKKGEEELKVCINDLRERYEKVQGQFSINFDQTEEKFVNLADEFRSFFRKRGFVPHDVAEAKEDIDYMDSVMIKIREINLRNAKLKAKYNDDEKFVRIHKRLSEENARRQVPPQRHIISDNERIICDNLYQIKLMVDDQIYYNVQVLQNEPVFTQDILRAVSTKLMEMNIQADREDRLFIRNQIAQEYLNTYTFAS